MNVQDLIRSVLESLARQGLNIAADWVKDHAVDMVMAMLGQPWTEEQYEAWQMALDETNWREHHA